MLPATTNTPHDIPPTSRASPDQNPPHTDPSAGSILAGPPSNNNFVPTAAPAAPAAPTPVHARRSEGPGPICFSFLFASAPAAAWKASTLLLLLLLLLPPPLLVSCSPSSGTVDPSFGTSNPAWRLPAAASPLLVRRLAYAASTSCIEGGSLPRM